MDLQNDIVHYHKLSSIELKKPTTFLWLVVVFTCNKSRGSIYFIARDTEKLGPAIVFWQIGVLLWARFFLKHACEKICPFSSSLSTTVVVFYEKCCFCACHENYDSSILQARTRAVGAGGRNAMPPPPHIASIWRLRWRFWMQSVKITTFLK